MATKTNATSEGGGWQPYPSVCVCVCVCVYVWVTKCLYREVFGVYLVLTRLSTRGVSGSTALINTVTPAP